MSDDQEVEEGEGLRTEEADGFSFNMKDEKASSGFPLIPVGNHPATIEEVTFGYSKNSGNPMWTIKWAYDEPELAQKNRKQLSWVIFSPEQRPRAKMFLVRVAPHMADLENFSPKAIAESGDLIGLKAVLKITTQKDKESGEERSNVGDVLAWKAGASSSSNFTL